MLFLGVDLAWKPANESGVVALDANGEIVSAGWAAGVEATLAWIEEVSRENTLLFVDAPLIVANDSGQRLCETHVGQRYWRSQVFANSTNRSSPRLAGVTLLARLEALGWLYSDGIDGPPKGERWVSECYPYTTIVGAEELGYDRERPTYKRPPGKLRASEFRPLRAKICDELIARMADLGSADPPLLLASHHATRALIEEASPLTDAFYKRREDLLDAAICAWTAALWARWGTARCQVLGASEGIDRPAATIISPARPEQLPSVTRSRTGSPASSG